MRRGRNSSSEGQRRKVRSNLEDVEENRKCFVEEVVWTWVLKIRMGLAEAQSQEVGGDLADKQSS